MRALEKNVTSEWFMTSNAVIIENLIKSLRWFIDIVFLLKNGVQNEEFISVTFELNLLSQTDIFGKLEHFLKVGILQKLTHSFGKSLQN